MCKARISEIFESVQGEGLYIGERQIFVRFFGCNLSCRFCDTPQNHFMEYEPLELLQEIETYQGAYHSISFTGGEPLLQWEFLKEVMRMTKNHGYSNYLETNGTLSGELAQVIDWIDIIAMDIKLPSSTGSSMFWGLHRKFLRIASRQEVFLKAIIALSTNDEDIQEMITLIKEVNPAAIVVLQPNSFDDLQQLTWKLERFRNLCVQEDIVASIIPQMHKVIGIP